MSQSSFTTSQPQSQPTLHSQHHMSASAQTYGGTPPSSSFYQGYPKMTQGPYAPVTPTQRQPLTTLQNNQTLPPSSFKVHTSGNTKVHIKSERSTSDGPFNSSLPDVSTSRATTRSFTSASSTNIKTGHVGRLQNSIPNDVPYLSYYQMEQIDKEKLARRQWLAKLGIDVNPFNFVFIDPLQRDKVEVHWALKSTEIGRDIEQKAIRLKQPYSKREVPLRLAPFALRTPIPIKLVGPVPLSFDELQQRYFNIPQRKILGYHDLIPERFGWLKELGLDDPRYLPLSQTALERQELNNFYDRKPRAERRAIEAKAKYINAMLNPPNPSWVTLEETYEIYPASAFTAYAAYIEKRRQWLQKLGLDITPFCYKTLELSEGNMQGMEVAWSAMTEVERNKVLETAKIIKEDSNPVVDSWSDFEYTYSFTKEKDKEFKNDPTGYAKKRGYWIIDIGLDADSTLTSLQAAWSKKPIEERKSIVNKAKYEKERYVRDLARKKAEKTGDNYKAPPSEAKKTSKRSSTSKSSSNKVLKSSSSRYGYSGYFGRSAASSYYGYSSYGYGRYGRY
ncbi:hypothetical protein EAF04_000693 [Stromatinia cepivora]|nr:hypothetical protein EAF04_000693 [Stromatinia cepivora]